MNYEPNCIDYIGRMRPYDKKLSQEEELAIKHAVISMKMLITKKKSYLNIISADSIHEEITSN